LDRYHTGRVVDVDWSYWKNAETVDAAAQLNEKAAAGQYVLCYSDASLSPFYLSADIHIDVPAGPQLGNGASAQAIGDLKKAFLAHLKADYGYNNPSAYPTECAGALTSTADVALKRALPHQRFHQLKFVEPGWTPGKAPVHAAAPAAPPAPPPPS